MAFMVVIMGLGLSFYIVLGFRKVPFIGPCTREEVFLHRAGNTVIWKKKCPAGGDTNLWIFQLSAFRVKVACATEIIEIGMEMQVL